MIQYLLGVSKFEAAQRLDPNPDNMFGPRQINKNNKGHQMHGWDLKFGMV